MRILRHVLLPSNRTLGIIQSFRVTSPIMVFAQLQSPVDCGIGTNDSQWREAPFGTVVNGHFKSAKLRKYLDMRSRE